MERAQSVGDLRSSNAKLHTPSKRAQKRRRRHSSEADRAKPHGGRHGRSHRPPPAKKAKLLVSSTRVANNVMKFRLGGSVSDPLNLEGAGYEVDRECSTCAPSPALESAGQPSPLPPQLHRDPLNLEGKVKDFPHWKSRDKHSGEKHGRPGKHKKRSRRRTVSQGEGKMVGSEEGTGEVKGEEIVKGKGKGKGKAEPEVPKFSPKGAQYCYGNYDKYYGYRNSGAFEKDVRLSLLKGEWFEGKDCLDIGSNTGQVTISIARDLHPRRMVGMDIDSKLVKIAWKNLHRHYVPSVTPDGRPFPLSFTLARGPVAFPPLQGGGGGGQGGRGGGREGGFPNNVEFVQGNYVTDDEQVVEKQQPEYDVILALSLTKWVHLNWGDAGVKRLFHRAYRHLRPGGRFIVEPQPFSSYAKRKKLTPAIYQNYHNIQFFPDQFHSYLMSPEVGFTKHRFLGVSENKSKGFRRPLHMYVKGERDAAGSSKTGSKSLREERLQVEGTDQVELDSGDEEADSSVFGQSMEAESLMDSGGDGGRGDGGEEGGGMEDSSLPGSTK